MDDTEQRYLPDWVILGDSSRTVFLGWLLLGKQLTAGESSVIWVRDGEVLSILQQAGQWIVETPALLPGMTLCLPPAGEAVPSLETSGRTRYAVVEAFPFRKQSNIDLIQRLEGRNLASRDQKILNREVLVVLMDLPRHQGSTDLVPPGEDLSQALAAYRAEGLDVFSLRDTSALRRMLHWHRPMYDVWVKRAHSYLSELQGRISGLSADYSFLAEDWEDVGGLLDPQTMDCLFSYQSAKRGKSGNLWNRYAAAANRALFPSAGQSPLAPVEALYRSCLDNPLVFWSVDADAADFMADLRSLFQKSLDQVESAGDYRRKTRFSGQLDEDSYLDLVARSKNQGTALNAVFSQWLNNYLSKDIKNCLQERLRQRCRQLEEMVP